MRKLVTLGLGAVLLVVVDQGTRLVAESQLAARAGRAAGGPDSAEASITSFPFLVRLLTAGSVPRVEVRVTGASAGPLRLAAVEVRADGVALDRGALLSGDVRLEEIDHGLVAVELDGRSLAEAIHLPVTIRDGQVRVGAGRLAVTAGVEVHRGSLVLRLVGLRALTVPVVRTPLVPCAATSVSVEGDRVRLSCEVDRLPAVLRR